MPKLPCIPLFAQSLSYPHTGTKPVNCPGEVKIRLTCRQTLHVTELHPTSARRADSLAGCPLRSGLDHAPSFKQGRANIR